MVQHSKVEESTLVFDVNRQIEVMLLDKIVVLPPGAEIELVDPNTNAKVRRVRLCHGDEMYVVLDVDIPEFYWEKRRERRAGKERRTDDEDTLEVPPEMLDSEDHAMGGSPGDGANAGNGHGTSPANRSTRP